MPIRNILLPIFSNVEFDRQLDAALGLARRLEGHINAVYIRPDPAALIGAFPGTAAVAGLTVEQLDREGHNAEAAAHATFDMWRAENALPCGIVDQSLRTPFACWSEKVGPLDSILVRCGRLSDLIILNGPNPSESSAMQAFGAAVFDTGRPTILLSEKTPDNMLRHIIVAWNGSLEATRAVAGAMPLLHRAERVSVFTAPRQTEDMQSGSDLAEFLTWHGIRAHCVAPHPGELPVGAALLRIAAESDATMLVMGGYTHSRVRQLLLGGVTTHVLHRAEIPVLMMH